MMTKSFAMCKGLSLGWGLVLAIAPLLVSCQPKAASDLPVSEQHELGTQQPKSPGASSSPTPISPLSQKITFRRSDGTIEFSLQFKSSGGKLMDASGQAMANLILEKDGAIRLTDANNNVVGYVVKTGETLRVESPKRTKTLFSFTREVNGNAVLTRSNGSTVYQLSATEGGYVVESDKAARYSVLTSKGKGQLQTDTGETIMATDGAIVPAALASFGFGKLTQAQQAGLAYALSTESID